MTKVKKIHKDLITISEQGRFAYSEMQTFTFGTSNTFKYKSITFKRKYKTMPTVITSFTTSTSKTYWGNLQPYTRSVTTTGCDIVLAFNGESSGTTYIDYIVISND